MQDTKPQDELEALVTDEVRQRNKPSGTHYVEPEFDRSIEKVVEEYGDAYLATNMRRAPISRDELCLCGNGGRLLPAACSVHRQQRAESPS